MPSHDAFDGDTLMRSDAMEAAQRDHAATLQRLETERLRRTVAVPTSVEDVRAHLRQLGEPICLFAEDIVERRERLKRVVADLIARGIDADFVGASRVKSSQPASRSNETNDGGERLLVVRMLIAKSSLDLAAKRVEESRIRREAQEGAPGVERERYVRSLARLRGMENVGSQLGDANRPVIAVRFAADSNHVATASWSGNVKLWTVSDGGCILQFEGHRERVVDLAFRPGAATSDCSHSSANLASSSADMTIRLWSLEDARAVSELRGHRDRLGRIAWHPSAQWIGSTSFDTTWRLWDVDKGVAIIEQDGHARPTYAIAFHCDGSLVATGDLGGQGRVWDLRTGRSILNLSAHVKQMVGCEFAANGWQLATCADDNTVRIWDIRSKRCMYTIPAHLKMVSDVRWGAHGDSLITASYDGTCRIWSAKDFTQIATLRAHEDKVTRVDLSFDSKYIVTSSFDRTWKVWRNDSEDYPMTDSNFT